MTLSGHTKGSLVYAFAADTDAVGAVAVVAEYGHSSGADPVASAVVLAVLLRETLLEHFLYPFEVQPEIFKRLFLVIVSGRFLWIVEPVQQLLRNIVQKVNILEKFKKRPVEFVEIRFAFYEHGAAKIIEIRKAGIGKPLVQSLVKGKPLVH